MTQRECDVRLVSCRSLLVLAVIVLETAKAEISSAFTYKGCYVDDASNRRLAAISKVSGHILDKPVAVEGYIYVGYSLPSPRQTCGSICAELRMPYMALQYLYSCYCGDAVSEADKRPEENCNLACDGDPSVICGGAYRNSVYTMNYTYSDDTFFRLTTKSTFTFSGSENSLTSRLVKTTKLQCAHKCLKNDGNEQCAGYYYNVSSGSCHLHRHRPPSAFSSNDLSYVKV